MASLNRSVDVVENVEGTVQAPDDTTTEESGCQENAIDSLIGGTGQIQLITEPMNVQEWRRKLVEQEDGSIEVNKRSLKSSQSVPVLSAMINDPLT